MMRRIAALLALGALWLGVERTLWPDPPLVLEVPPGRNIDRAILVDQGIRGGWAQTDPVIRRQLVQALRFAGEEGTDSELVERGIDLGLPATDPVITARIVERVRARLGQVADPTPAQLERWLADHPERYQGSPVYVLEQDSDIAALAPLQRGTTSQLAGRFGDGFAAGVGSLEVGEEASLESSYGRHRVRLVEIVPAPLPTMQALEARLEQDWTEARRARVLSDRMAQLRAMYEVRQ